MEELSTMISTMGFPIVACVYMMKNNEKFISAIQDLTVTLKGIDTRITIIEQEREEK